MERELYQQLYRLTYDLARTHRTKHVVHPDWRIVMVWFWAVLHDRPVCWACDRHNWPPQASTLRLPDDSTISRRRRRPQIRTLIDHVQRTLQQRLITRCTTCIIDAKPMPIGHASRDRQATAGYCGAHRLSKGYKLHMICTDQRVPLRWTVRAMNEREPTVADSLIAQLPAGPGTLLADSAYDSNRLYDLAGQRGWQLVATRGNPHAKSLGHHKHSPRRLLVHQQWNQTQRRNVLRPRENIERCFAHQTNTAFGLSPLTNWVRTLERVTAWIDAKITIHLMYLCLRRTQMQ